MFDHRAFGVARTAAQFLQYLPCFVQGIGIGNMGAVIAIYRAPQRVALTGLPQFVEHRCHFAEAFQGLTQRANAVAQALQGVLLFLQGFVLAAVAQGIGGTFHGVDGIFQAAILAKPVKTFIGGQGTGIVRQVLLGLGAVLAAGTVSAATVALIHQFLLSPGKVAHTVKHLAQRTGHSLPFAIGGDLHVFNQLAQFVDQVAGFVPRARSHQGGDLVNHARQVLLFDHLALWGIFCGIRCVFLGKCRHIFVKCLAVTLDQVGNFLFADVGVRQGI